MGKEVFISHSSEESELAGEICAELEAHGFDCWIAPRDIEPGAEYAAQINAAIRGARVFLLVLSAKASRSRHVRRELEIADNNGVFLLPVRVEAAESFGDEVDYYVRNRQWLDAFERPLRRSLSGLVKALREQLGDPEARRAWTQVGGHLADRYAVTRPRALLSIDGGGVRGAITLRYLSRIEELLAARSPDPDSFRLCHYFDYLAGSGTGALFAIGLARGMTIGQLTDFFRHAAPQVFSAEVSPFTWDFTPRAAVPHSPSLRKQIETFVGEGADLSPANLQCLLMVVMRSVTTKSPWPISSNPLSKYNDLRRPDCNLRITLESLARASLAWSPYAEPVELSWDPNDPRKSFVFADGTYTPYNNPSFMLYQMATSREYKINWKKGERNLLLVSVGAGDIPYESGPRDGSTPSSPLEDLLKPFIRSANFDQDLKCRSVGRCIHGAMMDRELGDMIPRGPDGAQLLISTDAGRSCTYVRYNVEISDLGLEALGMSLGRRKCPSAAPLMRVESAIKILEQIGRHSARAVSEEHFSSIHIPL